MIHFLRDVERTAWLACFVMAAIATAASDETWRAGAAVVGGGGLAAISYRGLRAGIAPLGTNTAGTGALVKFFTRHAILAFAAYVMLARLRMPPLGVIAGASSLVIAIAVAAARSVGTTSRSGHPR